MIHAGRTTLRTIQNTSIQKCQCGRGGIRTHGTLSSTPHFECGAFDHSATLPLRMRSAHKKLPRHIITEIRTSFKSPDKLCRCSREGATAFNMGDERKSMNQLLLFFAQKGGVRLQKTPQLSSLKIGKAGISDVGILDIHHNSLDSSRHTNC